MAVYMPDRERCESEKINIFKQCHLALSLHILK